jgi:hypothetical protein
MGIIEAILAFLGLMALVMFLVAWLDHDEPSPLPTEPDLAAPYLEGLHASVRLQRAAQDLEQQMYVEAAKNLEREVRESGSERS